MQPADRAHWTLIGAGVTMALFGNVTWDIYELVLHEQPFPSVADLFYCLQYPLLAAGFLRIVRLRTGGKDRATTVDTRELHLPPGASSIVIPLPQGLPAVPSARSTSSRWSSSR